MMIATSRQEAVHTFNKRMKSWKHWKESCQANRQAIAMAAKLLRLGTFVVLGYAFRRTEIHKEQTQNLRWFQVTNYGFCLALFLVPPFYQAQQWRGLFLVCV
jgi:hypothetical protein